MTSYYSKSHNNNIDNHPEFSDFLSKCLPKTKATAYDLNIVNSPEKLYGNATGLNNESDHPLLVLDKNRRQLVDLFKMGLIAYEETPLGACVSIEPCEKKLHHQVAACIKCPTAVLKKSHVDRAITNLQQFLKSQKSENNAAGFETRFEELELESLIELREKWEKRDE